MDLIASLSTPRGAGSPAVDPAAGPARTDAVRDGLLLGLLLAFAAGVRLLLFNGFLGSDDVVYLNRAVEIAHGEWSSANYNGSLRYGYNIPSAFFIALFGIGPYSANAWTLVASLGEIAVVYVFAARYFSRRAAVYAALLLGCVPLHVALATRIHADAVLGLFLTLSFVLLYEAERVRQRGLYFATGLALGMVFWVKELAAITFLAFATYPLFARRLDRRWAWLVAGGLVMLALHLALMQAIANDPFHLFKTVAAQVQSGVTTDSYNDSAGFYFRYLFFDVRHTWLLGLLALAALIVCIRPRPAAGARRATCYYLAWWLLALLIVLSFTPVSFSPLRLTMKQSNYLNLFLAPMALLGAALLARMRRRRLAAAALALILAGDLALAAVEQHAYRVFSANSRAAVTVLRSHPNDWLLGSVNNKNIARVAAVLQHDPTLDARVGLLFPEGEREPGIQALMRARPTGFAVFDLETLEWGRDQASPEVAPSCWQLIGPLAPELDGPGYLLLHSAEIGAAYVPRTLADAVAPTLARYSRPRPATLYRVDARNLDCRQPPQPAPRPDLRRED